MDTNKINMKNMELMLSYSEVFGKTIDIEDEIKKLNVHKAISIVCELLSKYHSEIYVDTQTFNIHLKVSLEYALKCLMFFEMERSKIMTDIKDIFFNFDKHIIDETALLILLKYILTYGDMSTLENDDYSIKEEDYIDILKLNMLALEVAEKDWMKKDGDLDYYLYAKYHMPLQKDHALVFTRSYYIFEYLAGDIELWKEYEKEYMHYLYYKRFNEKYGYTPIEYLSVIFWQLNNYNNPKLSYSKFWNNLEVQYSNTPLKEIAKKVLHDLAYDILEHKKCVENTMNSMLNFRSFKIKPFIRDMNDNYISVSEYTLLNCFFEKIYWMIRDCFPKDQDNCMAFFGRMFERYLYELSRSALVERKDLIVRGEFACGDSSNDKSKKSSDLYLKKGSKLIIVEAKGISVLADTIDNNVSHDLNIDKLLTCPALQADERFHEILGNGEFKDISEAYILTLTIDNINAIPEYISRAKNKFFGKKKCEKIKDILNLSIHDYELLMSAGENGFDIFDILQKYIELQKSEPFDLFIIKYTNKNIGMTKFLSSWYKRATDKMIKLYGVNAEMSNVDNGDVKH